MKIERISPNKIKVTLTYQDLQDMDININTMFYNSPATQELFWRMIKKAEAEAGFYVDGSQLVVEAMPARGEGFVMIITKLEDEIAQMQKIDKLIKSRVRKAEGVRAKPAKQPRTVCSPTLYAFSGKNAMEDLISALSAINSRFLGLSSLYLFEDTFYLALEIAGPLSGNDVDAILSDFSERLDNVPMRLGFLTERASCIVKDTAIGTICDRFLV